LKKGGGNQKGTGTFYLTLSFFTDFPSSLIAVWGYFLMSPPLLTDVPLDGNPSGKEGSLQRKGTFPESRGFLPFVPLIYSSFKPKN
jgi:hypothetical protein